MEGGVGGEACVTSVLQNFGRAKNGANKKWSKIFKNAFYVG